MARTLLLATSLLITISAQHLPPPIANYRHEIIYSDEGLLSESEHTPEILPFSATTKIPTEIDFQLAGNVYETPALHSVNLFTPNTIQQPAETPGQVANYIKALQEEAKQAAMEKNASTRVFEEGFRALAAEQLPAGQPKAYVNVRVGSGPRRYDYRYMFY